MKRKKWHICWLSIICISAMSLTEAFAMSPETMKSIEHWRTEVLTTADSEEYWTTLKELGEKITEADAQRIETEGKIDTVSSLALMAHQVATAPEKVDEISGWYGVFEHQVSRDLRGVESDEIWEAMQGAFRMKRATGLVERIRDEHKNTDYLHAWEAWMLSPNSRERYHMRQRMNEALAAIGNERTITILVEKCRVLPQQIPNRSDPANHQKAIEMEADAIRRTIRTIGGKAAILGLLEYARIAEKSGYAGDGPDSARSFVVYLLSSSRHPRALADNPEWAESLRDPDNPDQLAPWDGKWKEFKPIIEEMLQNPGDLRQEDVKTLKAALDAMPK